MYAVSASVPSVMTAWIGRRVSGGRTGERRLWQLVRSLAWVRRGERLQAGLDRIGQVLLGGESLVVPGVVNCCERVEGEPRERLHGRGGRLRGLPRRGQVRAGELAVVGQVGAWGHAVVDDPGDGEQ